MSRNRRWLGAAWSFFALSLAFQGACGGPSKSADGCPYAGWQGSCELKGTQVVRVMEGFPKSFIVYQVTYEPISGDQRLSPPMTRFDVTVPADQEAAFLAHYRAYPQAACRVNPADPAACEAGRVDISVPQFVASASTAQSAPVATGCEKLDAHGDVAQRAGTGRALEAAFRFEQDSVIPADGADAAASTLAQLILAHPGWECVAVSGHVTFGENVSLADQRARAIKALLVSKGVAQNRLITYGATVGAVGGEDRVARPEERAVRLRVVLDAAAAAPGTAP